MQRHVTLCNVMYRQATQATMKHLKDARLKARTCTPHLRKGLAEASAPLRAAGGCDSAINECYLFHGLGDPSKALNIFGAWCAVVLPTLDRFTLYRFTFEPFHEPFHTRAFPHSSLHSRDRSTLHAAAASHDAHVSCPIPIKCACCLHDAHVPCLRATRPMPCMMLMTRA